MTSNTHPSFHDQALSDPRAARSVEAFRDALIRMRDGGKLTTVDIEATADLLRMVQEPSGTALAAAAMPLFREVFQGGGASSDEAAITPLSNPAPPASTPCRCVRDGPEPRWW